MGISRLNPSEGGIPYGNTAGRPANPGIGRLYSNGELQRLELYTGATYGWQNIVAETPGVTGYTGTVIETNSTNTINITGSNFAAGATATLVGTDGTEITANTTTVSNLTSITATFGALSASIEPYDIRVTNPSNLYGVYYDILTVNDKPMWTTAAGSLGTIKTSENVSIQLAATDEENNSLTYSLVSGSLPTGLTLSSSGLISGTASGVTSQTFNFTISVSDGINTAQNRVFSIAYNSVPVISGGTLSSDSTYYYRTFTSSGTLTISNKTLDCDYLVVAGGGGGGGAGEQNSGAGGGGAGGYLSGTTTLSVSSHSVIVGGSGSAGLAQNEGFSATKGTNSELGSVAISFGGGAAPNSNSTYNGNDRNGGSGAGGTGNTNAGQLGYPGSGTVGQGNAGGNSWYGQGGSYYSGGGGGGAGAAGGNASSSSTNAGVGGAGLQWVNGNYYAGGGAGGTYNSSTFASGGTGGGGNSGGNGNTPGGNGTANTGGGGGGAGGINGSGSAQPGGNGGSGIVIIRYTKASVGG